jgi:hypothetical protein
MKWASLFTAGLIGHNGGQAGNNKHLLISQNNEISVKVI